MSPRPRHVDARRKPAKLPDAKPVPVLLGPEDRARADRLGAALGLSLGGVVREALRVLEHLPAPGPAPAGEEQRALWDRDAGLLTEVRVALAHERPSSPGRALLLVCQAEHDAGGLLQVWALDALAAVLDGTSGRRAR